MNALVTKLHKSGIKILGKFFTRRFCRSRNIERYDYGNIFQYDYLNFTLFCFLTSFHRFCFFFFLFFFLVFWFCFIPLLHDALANTRRIFYKTFLAFSQTAHTSEVLFFCPSQSNMYLSCMMCSADDDNNNNNKNFSNSSVKFYRELRKQ